MSHIPFRENDLRDAVEAYKSHTKNMPARTLDEKSFWDEETRMLEEFPDAFEEAGCIPEPRHLKCLTKWKWAGLWANHAHKNTREEIRSVTSDAFQLELDGSMPEESRIRQQLRRLSDLTGISAATGSVLLTFWRPHEYSVMDQRALATLASADLWTGKSEANVNEYPEYLELCRSISTKTGLDLRDTDRALWFLAE